MMAIERDVIKIDMVENLFYLNVGNCVFHHPMESKKRYFCFAA